MRLERHSSIDYAELGIRLLQHATTARRRLEREGWFELAELLAENIEYRIAAGDDDGERLSPVAACLRLATADPPAGK